MTDAAIIYRSHFEAIENLPEDQQLTALKAIIRYCMEDEIPEDGISSCILMMAKPILDKWKSNRRAGQKGGEANRKQPESNSEASCKQLESNCEPKVKVKVKEKVKDNKKHTFGEYKKVSLTDDEYRKLVSEFGEQKTDQAIAFLDAYIAEKGYKSKSHYLAIRRWVFDAIEQKKPVTRTPGRFQNFENRTEQSHKDMVAKLIAMQTGG